MASTEHAFQAARDHVSLLSSSVCVPDIWHSHQKKTALLRVELLHALPYHDGFDDSFVLPAIGNGGTNGRWYNSVVIFEHYSAYPVRFTSSNFWSTAHRCVLRAHYVEHFYVSGFLLYCADTVPPFAIPVTSLAAVTAMWVGIQSVANATGMEQNQRKAKKGGEERKICV